MLYRELCGEKISALGFGSMRLPVIDHDDAKIDEAKAEEMVDYAYEHGINYFDSAWTYHGSNSETFMANVLRKYPRESYFITSKFP
ncbi:MAG TPA: aldo/keto reductase, partial [Methanocorpusculum sp.]|nr:aldo/keto reductase [Methanocorpusculum sp.]